MRGNEWDLIDDYNTWDSIFCWYVFQTIWVFLIRRNVLEIVMRGKENSNLVSKPYSTGDMEEEKEFFT